MSPRPPSTPLPEPHAGGFEEAAAFFAPLREAPLTPRGRATRFGAETLADREVLAGLIAATDPAMADAGAGALAARFRSLEALLAADLSQLSVCAGLEAALTLKLAHELAARAAREKLQRRDVISSWTALVAYLRSRLAGRGRESIYILYLDKKNRLIADERFSEGTVDWAPLRPREVVRRALELEASFFIISHVHPSGDPTPSKADIEITRDLAAAAKAVGLALHDHIIIGEGVEVSFKQEGLV